VTIFANRLAKRLLTYVFLKILCTWQKSIVPLDMKMLISLWVDVKINILQQKNIWRGIYFMKYILGKHLYITIHT
jgi:hypothetical protein